MEYLLKSALLSAMLFAFYKVFLQKDTFFSANRIFFLAGMGIAFLLPLLIIPIKKEVIISKTSQEITQISINEIKSDHAVAFQSINDIDWLQLILYLYGLGVLILSIKFITELLSLAYLIYHNPREKNGKSVFVNTKEQIAPFSFFVWIVFNKNQFTKGELAQIIKHEKAHVTHWHSVDLILAQFLTIIQWFNPFVWFYKKELQQNLEYIADQKANEKESNLKNYQYLLLKTGIVKDPFALTNNFFNSHLKKRIIMLQKSKTNRLHQLKYVLIIPILAVFLYSFNTKEVFIVKEKNETFLKAQEKQKADNLINTPTGNNKHLNQSPQKTPIKRVLKTKEPKYLRSIDKNSTDSYLKEVTAYYKKLGFDVDFNLVKRNAKSEITGINIRIKSKDSENSYHFDYGKPIDRIILDYDSKTKQIIIKNIDTKPLNYTMSNGQTNTKTITINNDSDSTSYSYSINNHINLDSTLNKKITVLSQEILTKSPSNKINLDSIKGKEVQWIGSGENELTINIDEENGTKTFRFNGKEFSEEEFLKLSKSDFKFIKVEKSKDSDFSQFNFDNNKNKKALKKIEKRLKKQKKELKKREEKLRQREEELLKREKELKEKNSNKVGSFYYKGNQYYYNNNNEFYDRFGNRITGKLEQQLIKENHH